jgi:hypothetical protein
MPVRRALCAAALVAGTALAAGCGGGASGLATTRAPPQTQTATTTAATPQRVVVKTPQQALIRGRDLPTEWTNAPSLPQGLACGSLDPYRSATRVVRTPRIRQLTAYIDVEETIGLFRSEQAAERAYRQLISPAAEQCFRATMRQRLRSYSASGAAIVAPVDAGRVDELGPQSRSARYTTTISGELGIGRTYLVATTTRVGRGVASTLVISGFNALREQTYARVAELAEERLTQLAG